MSPCDREGRARGVQTQRKGVRHKNVRGDGNECGSERSEVSEVGLKLR